MQHSMKIRFVITSEPTLPAFAGFIQGSALQGEIHIGVNMESSALACAEHGIPYTTLLAENTVHEMIHAFQELYDKAFDEDEVEDAIQQARDFLKAAGTDENMIQCPCCKGSGFIPKEGSIVDEIRALEWIVEFGAAWCAFCGESIKHGHTEDCPLAAIMRRLK